MIGGGEELFPTGILRSVNSDSFTITIPCARFANVHRFYGTDR